MDSRSGASKHLQCGAGWSLGRILSDDPPSVQPGQITTAKAAIGWARGSVAEGKRNHFASVGFQQIDHPVHPPRTFGVPKSPLELQRRLRHHRPLIRATATWVVIGMLAVFAWQRRPIVALVVGDFLQPGSLIAYVDAMTNETLASAAPVASRSPHESIWSVHGFPLDAVHVTKSPTSTTILTQWTPLVINVGWWILFGGIGWVAWRIRPGQTVWAAAWPDSRRGRVTASMIVGAWFLVTGCYFVANHRQQRAVAQEMNVMFVDSIRFPGWKMLPEMLRSPFRHPFCGVASGQVAAQWTHTDRQTLATLRYLSLDRGTDAITPEALVGLRQVQTLHVVGLPPAKPLAALTTPLTSLSTLRVSFESPSAGPAPAHLMDFRPLQRLRRLALIGLPSERLHVDAFQVPSLTNLLLQLQPTDDVSFDLSSLPDLEMITLRIDDAVDENSSDEEIETLRRHLTQLSITLTLRDLPALANLSLDPRVPIRLTCENTPRLPEIRTVGLEEFDDLLLRDQSTLLVRSLKIRSALSLQSLHFRVLDLESLECVDVPRLTSITIGTPPLLIGGREGGGREGGRSGGGRSEPGGSEGGELGGLANPRKTTSPLGLPNSLRREIRRRAFRESLRIHRVRVADVRQVMAMARSAPMLQRLELNQVDLRGESLDELAGNPRLRELQFSDCQFRPGQVRQMTALRDLRRLSISHSNVSQTDAEVLLTMHDRWETLILPWENYDRIDVHDQPNLQLMFSEAPLVASRIRLTNLPRLRGHLQYQATELGGDLRLDGLPLLDQLTVVSHRKVDTTLSMSGLTNLRQLTLMGVTLTASALTSIAEMDQLTTLRVVDCRDKGSLAEAINGLFRLQCLIVQRTPLLNWSAIRWARLTQLRSLVLDDVGGKVDQIPDLAACRRLQYLSIKGWDASPESLVALATVPNLIDVSVDRSDESPRELWSIEMIRGDTPLYPRQRLISSPPRSRGGAGTVKPVGDRGRQNP